MCPPKVEGAEECDEAIRERDRPCQWFIEEEIHQTPQRPREDEGDCTHHQQRFLQANIIIVIWVRANTGYDWERPLNNISEQLIASFMRVFRIYSINRGVGCCGRA